MQKLIFVTGKGGVGKSTIAAAIALKQSEAGKRTLLVELGYQSFYKDYFNLPSVSYQPNHFLPNLDIALWSGPECLREYALHLLRSEQLYRLFFENPVSRALIQIAPGLSELAILGKITSGIRKVGPPMSYDVIVIDAFATGHFMALLKAPYGMSQAITLGPMSEHSKGIDRTIKDPRLSSYFVVTLPEELPTLESLELAKQMKDFLGVAPEIIMNRLLLPPADLLQEEGSNEAKQLQKILQRERSSIQQIKATGLSLQEVPLSFAQNSLELIKEVAHA